MKLGNLRRKPATTNAEEGYFLIVIMIMVSLLAIASLARVQSLVTELKREREEELVHRGVQYARAIKKYYKWSKGQYPVSLDQLDKTNNMRFLRKRYKDPVTGGDFRLIRMTDFLAAQNSQTGSLAASGTAASGNSASGSLNPPAAQSILNATGFGSASGSGNASGQQTSTASSAQDNSDTSGSTFGKPISSGPTFGGSPIVGVASTSSKVSLKEFDKKNHYKDWLFIYVPQMDVVASATGAVPPLIKGPFVKSQLTGGVGGQNQPLFPNQPNQPNQLNQSSFPTQPSQITTPMNPGNQGNQTNQ
jgi:type II secretory pathway pseudopilin PulG